MLFIVVRLRSLCAPLHAPLFTLYHGTTSVCMGFAISFDSVGEFKNELCFERKFLGV
jgi:hypothetical protein